MGNHTKVLTFILIALFCAQNRTQAAEPMQFRDLFNGKDLSGWINVNTDKDTWTVRDGMIICTGHPIGVMRTVPEGQRLPRGVEVQMLELEWPNLHRDKDGKPRDIAYVSGEVWGVGGLKTTPDNPRGERSKSVELRCKGKGEWDTYDLVAVDGIIKLAINGKFVNGISNATIKKGYICLESEGAEIHFRNIRIMELPPGVTSPEQTAPVVDNK
jgi:hypothetical protein